MSQVPFGAVKRVVEGAAPYRRGCPRFRQSRNAARTLAARGTAEEQKRIPFLLLTLSLNEGGSEYFGFSFR